MRLLVGLVVLPLCFGGVAWAHPTMSLPAVSAGSNPYRSFGSAETTGPGPHFVMAVPEGQEFIITMISVGGGMNVMQNETLLVPAGVIGAGNKGSLTMGRSHVRVESGTSLDVSEGGAYNIQGFFIEEGSPYRSTQGTVFASAGPETVFTADSDRDFLVRTFIVGWSTNADDCDLYLDGSFHLPGQSYVLMTGFYLYAGPGGMAQGSGTLVVPAGSNLQLKAGSDDCVYYMDGEYIAP